MRGRKSRLMGDGLSSPSGLPESPHQVQDVIHVAPVEDAAMDDRPASFVVGADHFCQVAVEIVIEPV